MTTATSRVTDFKMFVPGPVPVADEVLAAMSLPTYGHRSKQYKDAHAILRPLMQQLYRTTNPVLGLTCPATGAMELLTRQTVRPGKRMVNFVNGAFSDRWFKMAAPNGIDSVAISADWGAAFDLEQLKTELAKGDVDAVTLTYSETSTGMLNPLQEVTEIVGAHSDTLMLVDAVSAVGGARLEFDAWGIDAAFAGVQKALACPPGFTTLALNDRVLKRAAQCSNRGWVWDLLELMKKEEDDYALATPSLAHMAALTTRLEYMASEGFDTILKRHLEMSACAKVWAEDKFGLLPPEDAISPTLTCVKVPDDVDPVALAAKLKNETGFQVGGGYGKLKKSTFRIAHMGECRMENLEELLSALDSIL